MNGQETLEEEKKEKISGGKPDGRTRAGHYMQKFGVLLALILLCVFFAVLSPTFLTINNIMNILGQSSINCLISFGMLLVILTSGIDLSVGATLALSSMFMAVFLSVFHVNSFVGLLLGLLCGTAVGFVNGVLLTKLHLPHPFISTLGTQNIVRGLALVITGATPISGFSGTVDFLGGANIGLVPVSIVLVAVCAVFLSIFLNRTVTGKHIYAVGGNKEAAKLSGINIDRTLITVYTLSGFLAGLAGIVQLGRVDAAFPLAGVGYENNAIAAVIIGGASFFGGVGKVSGTIIGVMIIAVLNDGLNLLGVSADMQTVAIGAVIILAVTVDVMRSGGFRKLKK
mgnify:CR=1 FL=1